MKTGERGVGEPSSGYIAYAGLTVIYFVFSALSLVGLFYAVSKASTVIWGSVKHCPDGLVCMVPDYLNTNAVLLAFVWGSVVFLFSAAFPGVRWRSFLRGLFVLAVFGAAWIVSGFVLAVLRLQLAWSEWSVAAVGVAFALVVAGMIGWLYRHFLAQAAFVSLMVVCFAGVLFLWISSTHLTIVGLEFDSVAYLGLPVLLLALSVPSASVGLSWAMGSWRLGWVASMFVSSALSWTLLALTQVIFVVIWFWMGQ